MAFYETQAFIAFVSGFNLKVCMSHFSATLQELTRGRLVQEIAEQIGMPRTTFTQYRLAVRPPTVEVLEQMLRAFSGEEQRKLVKAYLDDETPASWFGRVRIEFDNGRPRGSRKAANKSDEPPAETAPGQAAGDDKELSAAITTLLARARASADVRQVILDLAAIV